MKRILKRNKKMKGGGKSRGNPFPPCLSSWPLRTMIWRSSRARLLPGRGNHGDRTSRALPWLPGRGGAQAPKGRRSLASRVVEGVQPDGRPVGNRTAPGRCQFPPRSVPFIYFHFFPFFCWKIPNYFANILIGLIGFDVIFFFFVGGIFN